MEVEPLDYVENEEEREEPRAVEARKEKNRSRLNAHVAVTVAILATFMGLCKVKDDNIVQAMQQAQAKSIDDWSWYQFRNVRGELAQATAEGIRAQSEGQPPVVRAALERKAAEWDHLAREQADRKQETRGAAEEDERTYNRLNFRDDQFDLSDALLALAISLLAITALTQKRWLFWVAMVPTAFGVLMGVAGLFGWKIHPGALVGFLS
ncbi:MAG TPA: DUF4337 domain-containing protein [Armatimonadota bacterium]|nr:DUF4337 domain-containing protein [Armatimonadota bacterium]